MALTPSGTAIRDLRKASGWTLRDFAAQAGISHPYLSRIENAAEPRNVSPVVLRQIAVALRVPLKAITGDEVAFRAALAALVDQPATRRRPRRAVAA